MKKLVYVVTGETGEYSDHSLWIAKIFSNIEIATNYKNFMNEKLLDSGELGYDERDALISQLEKYDDKLHIDYTGAFYNVEKIFLDDIPEILLKDNKA